MTPEELETLLWDYADGRCTAEEATFVQQLLQKDAQWQARYEALRSFNESMNVAELEQPSMRFTKNVMDAITQQKPVHISQRSWVVWALGVFFVAIIAIGFFWAVTSDSSSSTGRFTLPEWSLNNRGLLAFLLGDVVVALLLMDQIVKKRRAKSV